MSLLNGVNPRSLAISIVFEFFFFQKLTDTFENVLGTSSQIIRNALLHNINHHLVRYFSYETSTAKEQESLGCY